MSSLPLDLDLLPLALALDDALDAFPFLFAFLIFLLSSLFELFSFLVFLDFFPLLPLPDSPDTADFFFFLSFFLTDGLALKGLSCFAFSLTGGVNVPFPMQERVPGNYSIREQIKKSESLSGHCQLEKGGGGVRNKFSDLI